MKRFTETLKWGDVWFRKLSPGAKMLWLWLCDNCDHAGIIEPDFELATFQIGLPMGIDTLSEFGDRVSKLSCGKLHIVKFVVFQYGDKLSRSCKAHNPVFQSLEKHGVAFDEKGYPKGIDTPQDKDKDKDKVQAKDKDTEKVPETSKEPETEPETIGVPSSDSSATAKSIKPYGPECRIALHWLNEKSGRHYRETESSLSVINARLSESGVDIEGVKLMIDRQCLRWKGTAYEEYLRPETLFAKTKFDGYYAAKDVPIKNGVTQKTPNYELGF